MNNLFIALMKKGIKPEQAAKVISQLLGCSERTARNKLKEVTTENGEDPFANKVG